ncbi:MAG: T9SS type A sorting domain-containing protein [Bacteroidota bacterium]
MLRLSIAICILLGLAVGVQAQLQIDTVFIANDTIIPDPNFQQQIVPDTVVLDNATFLFQGISTRPLGVDSVFWRVSIDYDEDGDFGDADQPFGPSRLFFSGKIPVGATPNVLIEAIGLLQLPFGSVRQVQIELTDNPNDFSDDSNQSSNYNRLIFFIIDNTGGRVTIGNKKKGSSEGFAPTDPECIDDVGIIKDQIFRFFIFNWSENPGTGDTCLATNIVLDSALIYERGFLTPDCLMDLTPAGSGGSVVVTLYDVGGSIIPYTYGAGGFDLETGEKAEVEITIPTPSCPASLDIGQIDIHVTYTGCINSPRFQDFCFDCVDTIRYTDHSTNPAGAPTSEELELPRLVYAEDLIELSDNVSVLAGDDTELVVNPTGAIHISGGDVWVQNGATFWAHQATVCPILTSAAIAPLESIETRSREINDAQIQVFPNPFRSDFVVQFDLEDQQEVSIALVDLFGRVKQTVLNKQMMKSGQQRVPILADTLTAGIYYCRVEIGEAVFLKSLVKVE